MSTRPSPASRSQPSGGGNATPEGSRPGLDRLSLVGLEARGHHGVLAQERRDGQLFRVDLVLGIDTRAAAAGDDLAETVDYGPLALAVIRAVESDPVDLLETLAQRVADLCLEDRRVQWSEVTVHKPHAPVETAFQDVALTIFRSR